MRAAAGLTSGQKLTIIENMPDKTPTPRTDAFAKVVGNALAVNRRDIAKQAEAIQSLIDERIAPMERELAAKEIEIERLKKELEKIQK